VSLLCRSTQCSSLEAYVSFSKSTESSPLIESECSLSRSVKLQVYPSLRTLPSNSHCGRTSASRSTYDPYFYGVILNQNSTVHTLKPYYPPSYASVSRHAFRSKCCMHFSYAPCMLHVRSTSIYINSRIIFRGAGIA
jgi:hypothetical protein